MDADKYAEQMKWRQNIDESVRFLLFLPSL